MRYAAPTTRRAGRASAWSRLFTWSLNPTFRTATPTRSAPAGPTGDWPPTSSACLTPCPLGELLQSPEQSTAKSLGLELMPGLTEPARAAAEEPRDPTVLGAMR